MLKRNNKEVKHMYKGIYALPDEYQEVEYLEGTGTQYIDTGIVITASKFDIDIAGTSLKPQDGSSGKGTLYWYRDNGSAKSSMMIGYVNNTLRIAHWSYGNITHSLYPDIPRFADHRIEFHTYGNSFNCNGVTCDFHYVTTTIPTKTPNYTFKLFYVDIEAFPSGATNARIEYFKLRNGNSIILNLIPCYRKSDSKPGMYDLISGEFFINQGTGEFITGPEVKKKVKFIIKDNRVIFADESLLPSEYRRVDSIKSDGNAYLKLDSNPDYTTITDITFKYTDLTAQRLFGVGPATVNYKYYVMVNYSSGKISTRYMNTQYDFPIKNSDLINKKINLRFGKQIYFNGKRIGNFITDLELENPNKIILFAYLNSGNYGISAKCNAINIYKCIIHKQNKLINYLIPSVRKLDNKPGMYDLVTDTFFTNNGTGEFEWEELEPQEDFIIDGTPLHTYKLKSLLEEISEDPENYVVIGNVSDIHGQCADDLEANDGSVYHCNLDQIDSSVSQLQSFMHKASMLGASTPATLFTGDFVGRIKSGTGTSDPSRNNETGADVISNINKLKTVYDTYAEEKDSSTPLVYGLGNHDARGFKTDSHTFEDARSFITSLNPQFTYPNTANCTGYWYDEKDDIVFVYFDNYTYTNGDSEGSAETIKSLLTQLNTQYPTSKFLLFGHQPIMKPSESTKCVNSEFYADLTTDNINLSPLSTGFNVTSYIPAEKILAGIYGHQHANALSIEYGYPIIQQPCLGELRNNDGGQNRHNYYNGTVQLGFVTEKAEFTNNAPAAYTYFIWTYNKRTGAVKCTTLGVGPDTTFTKEGNELALHGFTHVFAPEPPASLGTIICQYISDPRWTVDTNPSEALAYGSTPFIYSSYAYQCDCSRKDGILQTPFGIAGQCYCFAYYTKNTSNGTVTFKGVSQMYPPLAETTPFLSNSVNITIQATQGATVIMNGQETSTLRVPKGTDVEYSVSKDGYSSESGVIVEPKYDVVKKIELEEEINPHYITLSSNNGTIILTPSKVGNKYNDGTLVSVSFSPNAEYKFKSATLTMGGTTQTYTDSFSFNITSDATINATFEEDSVPWIAGNTYEINGVPVKYAFIQATDNKYNSFNWDTATLETPNPIKDANWAMFMWVENPNTYGLTSVTLHGNSDIDYSYRANFSCYTGKNYTDKLNVYSDLVGRGSSMGQNDTSSLNVNTSDAAIGWAYKLSNDTTNTYFTPTGRFFTKLSASLSFNK